MSESAAHTRPEHQQRAMIEFERAVYSRDYAGAVKHLVAVLEGIEREGAGAAFADRRTSLRIHTRFASAVTALLADREFELDFATYLKLSVVRRNLSLCLAASGFGDGRHLAPLAGRKRADGTLSYATANDVHRMLLGLDLAAGASTVARMVEKLDPPRAVPAVLGLLRQRVLLTPREEESRSYLLSIAPTVLDAGELTGPWTSRSLGPWFYCSYAASPRRHTLKAALNRAYRRHLAATGITDRALPPRRRRVERPTLLVVAETFRTGHAMYRCYSGFLAQTAGRFHRVLMARNEDMDPAAAAEFDDVIAASGGMQKDVGAIERLDPDMIFYPSVGMRISSIMLANLRLAPIQFMSIGHPASSFSDAMDYLVIGRDVASEAADIHEKVVVLDCPGAEFVPHRDDPQIAPSIREHAVPLRLAVPARSMKLTAAFVSACQRITQKAGRPIEFHFFPNEQGSYFRAVENILSGLLPGATVYPTTDYATYMRRLNECDIALSPFPFGSSNSAVDAALQGIPMVAFEGADPQARTDRGVLRAVGLPDWLLAGDEEGYIEAVLRLCRDDRERVALSRALGNARERLFVDKRKNHPTAFVEALEWIYEHHEAIQGSSRRFWWPEDRAEASAGTARAAR